MTKSIIGQKTTIKFGTKNINLEITGINKWAEGDHKRTYLEIDGTERMFDVQEMFIDHSGNAKRGAYDFSVETDQGDVLVKCNNISSKKQDAIESALWDMLDD
jgi:hypothetical protein